MICSIAVVTLTLSLLLTPTLLSGSYVPNVNDLVQLEEKRLGEVQQYIIDNNVHVQGFFHMSRMSERWRVVLEEQLLLMNGSFDIFNIHN